MSNDFDEAPPSHGDITGRILLVEQRIRDKADSNDRRFDEITKRIERGEGKHDGMMQKLEEINEKVALLHADNRRLSRIFGGVATAVFTAIALAVLKMFYLGGGKP